jgi:CelD/BcsL family acetyltransferase involved in cellulose biosynthesis
VVLTVELRRDLDLPPPDATTLESLIAGCPRVGVFLSKAWLSGFFAEPPRGTEPSLLLVREAGVLRGLTPIAIRKRATHVRVGVLGGGAGSDRVDLLAVRGYEAACADAVVAWLPEAFGRRGFVLELRDVPAESPLWGAVYRANAEGRHLVVQPREVHTLPYLDLTDAGPAASPGGSADHRANSLDKHRRWLERKGRLNVELLKDPCEVASAFEALVQFLHRRWHGRGTGSVLDQPAIRRFHERTIPFLLAEARLRMLRLTADERTIAVFYGLGAGTWWGYYLAGYDREWARRIQLGRLTLGLAVETAVRHGAAEFDFLKGADRVKYGWAVRERATLDADVYSGTSGAQLTRASRAVRDAVAAVAKSVHRLVG